VILFHFVQHTAIHFERVREMSNAVPNIQRKTDSLLTQYPEVEEFTKQQLKIFWLPDEVKVEKDVQDVLVNMTKQERHGVTTVLKLFTQYELKAGAEYWTGRFKRRFPRPEFQEMAATFGMFELAIHKRFYQKINELLFLHTDEFYGSYGEDPVLQARMEFIDSVVSDPDDLVSLAGFALVEGAILYSSFAFLKHFQQQGKNKLLNLVRGINFSVRDENLHSLAGAWVFKKLLEEQGPKEGLTDRIYSMAAALYSHECRIVDMIFEEGPIEGITSDQLKAFALSRVNEVLSNLGYDVLGSTPDNPIAEWFYKAINSYTFNDFFSGMGSQYHRDWDEQAFVWKTQA
jgi:ribonucleotide reductase beta subunit family protein with ferritin-like domain